MCHVFVLLQFSTANSDKRIYSAHSMAKRIVPPTVTQVVNTQNSATYRMSHLLVAGYQGTTYQLLVLLSEMVKLYAQDASFEAMVEVAGYEILDDIGLVVTDNKHVTSLKAYQVKYYTHPISVNDFLNKKTKKTEAKTKAGSKAAKMHIGKFFNGWLVWKSKKYNNVQSILYTNASLDETLRKCVTKEGAFNPHVYITHENKKLDLYELLYNEAWKYLETKKCHMTHTKKSEVDRKELFEQFMSSFMFKVQQAEIEALDKSIQDDLAKKLIDSPGHVYLCLYYAIQEWFYHKRRPCGKEVFTNKIMKELIQTSLVCFKDFTVLQGRTEATLSHISFVCEHQKTVHRAELDVLQKALSQSGLVMITGERGMGKSGLVKQALCSEHPTTYLALPAVDLVEDEELQAMLLEVVKKNEVVCIVVLDGAEALLQIDYRKLLSSLLDLE